MHHSAGFSTSSDFPAVVRYYWDLHVNTNGWDDIGYNWLIDAEGVIYEGRGDGNRGAHFSCMNSGTMGVCLIGNFEEAEPTADVILSLQELVAWESCDKGISIMEMRYHNSSAQQMHTLSGHRDGNSSRNACTNTVCPGANLYTLLSDIRSDIVQMPCLQSTTNSAIFEEKYQMEAGPNPMGQSFRISVNLNRSETTHYRIYDLLGQLHFEYGTHAGPGPTSLNINVSDFPDGVYILTVTIGKDEMTMRLIK